MVHYHHHCFKSERLNLEQPPNQRYVVRLPRDMIYWSNAFGLSQGTYILDTLNKGLKNS